MTVHPIPTTVCFPQSPNSATGHQVYNQHVPQFPVLESPSQTSCTQPEVVAQFPALKESLTHMCTNMCTVLCSFKNAVSLPSSWISYYYYRLEDIGHLLSSMLWILEYYFIYSNFLEFCISQALFRLFHIREERCNNDMASVCYSMEQLVYVWCRFLWLSSQTLAKWLVHCCLWPIPGV